MVGCPFRAVGRWAGDVCRKIDEVLRPLIANIKISALPFVGRLQAGDSNELGPPTRDDRGGAARNQRFVRSIEPLDGLGSETEIMAPVPDRGPNAEIALEKRNKGGKKYKGVWRKMMGLKMEGIQEPAEEIAGWKGKAALEVGEKNYPLPEVRYWRGLPLRRDATRHPRRDPTRFPRPFDVGLSDKGALPTSPPLELELAGSGGGFIGGGGSSR